MWSSMNMPLVINAPKCLHYKSWKLKIRSSHQARSSLFLDRLANATKINIIIIEALIYIPSLKLRCSNFHNMWSYYLFFLWNVYDKNYSTYIHVNGCLNWQIGEKWSPFLCVVKLFVHFDFLTIENGQSPAPKSLFT